jgi:putative serine protease PepD
LGLKVDKGAMVVEVVPGGPADKAGLKGAKQNAQVGNFLHPVDGDIIIRVDQLEVRDAEDLIKHLRERKIGEVVNLQVIRDGKNLDIKVTLQERPRNFRRPNEKSR